MKKIIFGAAMLVCAAAMVSCGGKTPSGISKGSRSKMDTLSYAIGMNIGQGISGDMPEMKFDAAVLATNAEKALFDKGMKSEDAVAILEEFFRNKRPQRLQKLDEQMRERMKDTTAAPIDPKEVDIFESDDERREVSEAYGADMGSRLRKSRLPLQTYWFVRGFTDSYSGGETVVTPDQAAMCMQTYFMVTRPAENKKASEEWLASIEKQSGVQKTESGLLYRIDREGDAAIKPKATDVVEVDYEGKFRDGEVFDSSYERGSSTEFPLNGVIKGWTEGLQLIGKGGQVTLWIPSDLAYGTYGSGMIGPNEALEFKVELLDVKVGNEPAKTEAPAAEAEKPAEEGSAE